MLYYKVVLDGRCGNQDIKNILYYREGAGLTWGDAVFGGSEVVAQNVGQEIVPSFLGVMPDDYLLESISVYPYNDLFQLVAQVPYVAMFNDPGTNGAAHPGNALAMNIRFNLEPTTWQNGVMPPRMGYIALGPMPASWVGEDGYWTASALANPDLVSLAANLGNNLEFLLPYPGTFYPIRVKHNKVKGTPFAWTAWADVQSTTIHPRATWRRSRMGE